MKLNKAIDRITAANDSTLCLRLGQQFFKVKDRKLYDFKNRKVTLTQEEQCSSNWTLHRNPN